ncbi:hypothetical protein M413DRAFT_31176 [Hebeloma cylindrosporum]|uniref:Uncharacterized protein n=1 Tax=Hebeloma cylindrosporum TaxID=76867 RepID=A0A0C3BY86_HEBCY|nr:hypothetical protein M413DRAFT_31176 [Hebeloma cylindrosporum h7]
MHPSDIIKVVVVLRGVIQDSLNETSQFNGELDIAAFINTLQCHFKLPQAINNSDLRHKNIFKAIQPDPDQPELDQGRLSYVSPSRMPSFPDHQQHCRPSAPPASPISTPTQTHRPPQKLPGVRARARVGRVVKEGEVASGSPSHELVFNPPRAGKIQDEDSEIPPILIAPTLSCELDEVTGPHGPLRRIHVFLWA